MVVWQERGGGGLCARRLRIWRPAGILQGQGGALATGLSKLLPWAPSAAPVHRAGFRQKPKSELPFSGAPAPPWLTVAAWPPLLAPPSLPWLLDQGCISERDQCPHLDAPRAWVSGQSCWGGALQLGTGPGSAPGPGDGEKARLEHRGLNPVLPPAAGATAAGRHPRMTESQPALCCHPPFGQPPCACGEGGGKGPQAFQGDHLSRPLTATPAPASLPPAAPACFSPRPGGASCRQPPDLQAQSGLGPGYSPGA